MLKVQYSIFLVHACRQAGSKQVACLTRKLVRLALSSHF